MIIKFLADCDMGTSEVPETHSMMLDGQSKEKATTRVIREDVASATQHLFFVLFIISKLERREWMKVADLLERFGPSCYEVLQRIPQRHRKC